MEPCCLVVKEKRIIARIITSKTLTKVQEINGQNERKSSVIVEIMQKIMWIKTKSIWKIVAIIKSKVFLTIFRYEQDKNSHN